MSRLVLEREQEGLTAPVAVDDILVSALEPFDLDPLTESVFYPWKLPDVGEFGLGLIVGASGSGKSTLLKAFGVSSTPHWQEGKAIVSHFATAQEAVAKLGAVGLNSVPSWKQPYSTLSTGQKFRADLARSLRSGAIIDEFTSVVDRNVAASAAKSVRGWVTREGASNVVLASCHRDIIIWLEPDWVIDTDAGTFTRGSVADSASWYLEHTEGVEVGRIRLK